MIRIPCRNGLLFLSIISHTLVCLLAAQQLQDHLQTQTDWQHNFGLRDNKETAIGKMFGILLVENKHHEIGYLAAFSGKIANSNHLPNFVPPVFDMLEEGGFFIIGQTEINQINDHIKHLESHSDIAVCRQILDAEKDQAETEIATHRASIIEGRKGRKQQRLIGKETLTKEGFIQLKEQLSKQSIQQNNQLRDLNSYWTARIEQAESPLINYSMK